MASRFRRPLTDPPPTPSYLSGTQRSVSPSSSSVRQKEAPTFPKEEESPSPSSVNIPTVWIERGDSSSFPHLLFGGNVGGENIRQKTPK